MDALNTKFVQLFGDEPKPQRFFCPGRVNLIGEHIDYLGGSVMPTAISLGITALVRPNRSSKLSIHSTDFDETIVLVPDSLPNSKQDHWSDFVLGVVIHLKSEGIELRGFDLLIDSNLPKGSGLSSSAALEVLMYFILYSMNVGSAPDSVRMALDCQRIENEFIGVNCGIMDQFAVANGKAGHAILLNCNTLEHAFIPLDLGNYSLLIINSNKPRQLAESAYNERRNECAEALRIVHQVRPIMNLVDATPDDLKLIQNPIIKQRARHAITEQKRVKDSVEALNANDLKRFGKLMTGSHISLRDDFEVSCAELDLIIKFLHASENCLGARMTGAGFGGCCVALIDSVKMELLTKELERTYTQQFGFAPSFYSCTTSDSVHALLHD